MPETVVTYNARGGPEVLPIRFLGPNQNFVLQTEPISHRLSANIPPRLIDLLEIAAAVFCADSSVSRGGLNQPRHGRTWRRDLSFEFAVRDLEFWSSPDIYRQLEQTIEFMTDDNFECRFTQSEAAPPINSYLEFESGSHDAFRIDDVILFSGGIDSLAGTLQTLETTDRRVALVTHRSATKTIKHQDEVIAQLRMTYGDRFLWIPVRVHRKGRPAAESTQRSRSFLFAALGCVVARMLATDRVHFFENGIVSQNLPLARAIVGTLATRTTHPQTLKHMEALLSQVSNTPITVENGFEWLTKTEVVGLLKSFGHTNLLPLTVSCNHTFKRKSDVRHCGACSQCLDRRFAVLANGLGSLEKSKNYATDVLFGTRERDDETTLAIEWVRHARRLAEMGSSDFQNHFMSELLRIAGPFDDKKEAFDRCHQMHQKHGKSVATVLAMLTDEQILNAPKASIAGALGGVRTSPATMVPQPEPVPVSSTKPTGRPENQDPIVLELMRADQNRIAVIELQDFTGVHARLISCLLDVHLKDRESGLRLKQYSGLKAREVADKMGVSEDYVRTEVGRIRKSLKDSWRAIFAGEPPHQILIKSIGKRGYRLDPGIIVVSPEWDQ